MATLTLAYQVTGDMTYAMRALRGAGTRLGYGAAGAAGWTGTRGYGRRGLLGRGRAWTELGTRCGYCVLRSAAAWDT